MSFSEIPHFRPHLLVQGGHLQTIVGACLSGISAPREISIRRRVEIGDGDQLLLIDDLPGSNWLPGGDVSILLHGLGGSSESSYVRRISAKLRTRGVRTFRLNLRGCGEGKGLARQLYHAGRTEDLQAAIETIAQICPGSRILLGGFSLGGNIVLKWLGEQGAAATAMVTRAVAVNPPVKLSECTRAIGLKMGGFYDRYFAKVLYRQLIQSFDGKLDRVKYPQPRRIIDFDNMITAPRSGFEDAEDYYARCSAAPLIPQVCVPTMIFSAQDDPLIPVRILEELHLPQNVQLSLSPSGGHLGYIGRNGSDPDRWWIDWRVIDWLTQ